RELLARRAVPEPDGVVGAPRRDDAGGGDRHTLDRPLVGVEGVESPAVAGSWSRSRVPGRAVASTLPSGENPCNDANVLFSPANAATAGWMSAPSGASGPWRRISSPAGTPQARTAPMPLRTSRLPPSANASPPGEKRGDRPLGA